MTPRETPRVDVDQEIEDAWAAFEAGLSDDIRGLADGESLVLEAEGDGTTDAGMPHVRILSVTDGTARRVEVSGDGQLSPQARSGAALLRTLGFTAAGDDPAEDTATWTLHTASDGHRDVAPTVVRVLREVLGVVHPILLAGMPSGPLGADLGPEPVGLEPVELDVAHPVGSADDLAGLVARTLAMMGEDPEQDEDGDWSFPIGHGVAWIRVLRTQPTVHVFAALVHSIRWRRAAAREVAILNRDAVGLRYLLDGEHLVVEVDVPAGPFVPRHLVTALTTLRRSARTCADDFALRTGGRA